MEGSEKYRVVIAGGGTGGHVFPALAIANGLKKEFPGIDILFVGAKGKLEMTKVPEAGYPIIGLPVSGLQRKLTLKNLMFPARLAVSLARSFLIVRRFRPDAAVGVGGYASGPLLFAAEKTGVPTLLQEQNSYPGITNKLLARKAKRICVAYEGMDRFFDPARTVLTGNPVRDSIAENRIDAEDARSALGFDRNRPLVLVIGGSLGARTLNESMLKGLDAFRQSGVQLYWQCGSAYFEEYSSRTSGIDLQGVRLVEFIREMGQAYAAADIIISRAGALSISELCLVGKPVILVPSPNVAEDHQTRNAEALVKRDAAIMVKDGKARESLAAAAVDLIGNEDKRNILSYNIALMARKEAVPAIVREIRELIESRR